VKSLEWSYYNKDMQEQIQRVIWCAGFFDGEGCIGFYGHHVQLHIRVTQKVREPLLALQELFGGGVYTQAKAYQWCCNSAYEARYVLESLLPYLVVKKAQAELALQFLRVTRSGTHYTLQEQEQRNAIVTEFRELRSA
jgi:hypothetical protein